MKGTKTARCWHILKTVKNVTVVKFELPFTPYRHNLKMMENPTVTNSVQSLQEFDANEMSLHFKNCLASLALKNALFYVPLFSIVLIYAFKNHFWNKQQASYPTWVSK